MLKVHGFLKDAWFIGAQDDGWWWIGLYLGQYMDTCDAWQVITRKWAMVLILWSLISRWRHQKCICCWWDLHHMQTLNSCFALREQRDQTQPDMPRQGYLPQLWNHSLPSHYSRMSSFAVCRATCLCGKGGHCFLLLGDNEKEQDMSPQDILVLSHLVLTIRDSKN